MLGSRRSAALFSAKSLFLLPHAVDEKSEKSGNEGYGYPPPPQEGGMTAGGWEGRGWGGASLNEAVRPEQPARGLTRSSEVTSSEVTGVNACPRWLSCNLGSVLRVILEQISWPKIGLFSFRPIESDCLTN